MYEEYVIWGIPKGATDETLLLARVNGQFITSLDDARALQGKLESDYGATGCRIQCIDGTPPDFVAAL